MSDSIQVAIACTEELDTHTQSAIIHVCRTAHQEDDFLHLFTYIPSGGIHVLAYQDHTLVNHAVATTRWLQPEGLPWLRTAYIDAVATLQPLQTMNWLVWRRIGCRFMLVLAGRCGADP